MWTQIRLQLLEQSDLSLHCLLERLLKQFGRRQKQTNCVVIGALRVKNYNLTRLDIYNGPPKVNCIKPEGRIYKYTKGLVLLSFQMPYKVELANLRPALAN